MERIEPILGTGRIIGEAKRSHHNPSSPLPAFTDALKQKVLERDEHTCRCCGFKSMRYQEVHFLNNNKKDTRLENMATMCIFCHQCFNLETVFDMRSGVLIWLPEILQSDLSNIARAIYVARITQGPIADAARRAFDILISRREEAARRIGTVDPFVLANVMDDYITEKHFAQRKAKLDGVRLLPLDKRVIKQNNLEFNQFPQILAYWRSKDGAFAGKSVLEWPVIHKDIFENARLA